MANKVAALLVICLVLVAFVQLPTIVAEDEFSSCFKNCKQECQSGGKSTTFCEMKCDTDCFDKDFAKKLRGVIG